ncbi:MAG: TonB-dependent receptor [Acidobacteria bacterium]|nr:TonB-dependent receptor [Acidobacteriota bacterium]
MANAQQAPGDPGSGGAQTTAAGARSSTPAAAPDGVKKTKKTAVRKPRRPAVQLRRIRGGEVVVTAPRIQIPLRENPAATTVIGPSTLATQPRTVGAEEALALVPGVKVDNQADAERVHLSIRGQGILTERGIRGIEVLLDGIPLNDPTGFAPDLFDVDWATVERIEVLRGPASALYGGSASGGIINIITRNGGGVPMGGRVRLIGGSHGFRKMLVEGGGSSDGMTYRVTASRTWGNGYRDHTKFSAANLYSKVRLVDRPGAHVTLITAGTRYFNENAEGLNIEQVFENPRQANPDSLTFNEYQLTRRGTGGVTGDIAVGTNGSVRFAGYVRSTDWKESVPSSVDHRTYVNFGGYLQYTLQTRLWGLANELSLGTDLAWQHIDDFRNPNLGLGVEGPGKLSDDTIHQSGTGVFALNRLELSQAWSVMIGVRYDSISNDLNDNLREGGINLSGGHDFSKATARAGVAWNPTQRLGFYASWGQGFLPPATEELANNPDHMGGFNRHLGPATSQGEEIGVRAVVANRLTVDTSVFHLTTKNDFGRYRIPSRPLETFYRNAGDSTRWGVETSIAWFPVDTLTIQLAYTYSDFTYDAVMMGDTLYAGTHLPNSPRHQLAFDAQYDLSQALSVGLSGELQGRAYIDATNTTWIGGYTLWGARLAWHLQLLGARGDLLVSARNLGGKKYIAFTEPDPDGNSYQPGPRREYFCGMALRF